MSHRHDERLWPLRAPGVRRRELIGLLPSIALLEGCIDPPPERIVPYVRQPPEVRAGMPLEYATAMTVDGFAIGLIAQARAGRPIKIEGNPDHPASLGAAGAFEQASVLSLYDPDRARGVQHHGHPRGWRAFETDVVAKTSDRPGLWFVMPPESSPLAAELIARVRERHPHARFCFHAPLDRSAPLAASRRLFGAAWDPHFDFSRARTVLALDADFTAMMPMSLRWARMFADGRRPSGPGDTMSRLYAAEPMPTPTGTMADHRLALPARDIPALAAAVLAEVMAGGAALDDLGPAREALARAARAADPAWVRAVAADLLASRGASIVVAGDQQPPATHVLAHALNVALGNLGQTVVLRPSPLLEGDATLAELADAIAADDVHTLIVLECNPVYTAPAGLGLDRAFRRVPRSAQLSLYRDETSQCCHWLLPALHYLERWGIERAYDGTLSLVQPLIRPLYAGRASLEVLARFAGMPAASLHDLVRGFHGPDDWEAHLQRGVVPESASAPGEPAPRWRAAAQIVAELPAPSEALELHFAPSPKVYDGRFANNPWLQELPHPLTKLTWDNAAVLSPADAARLGVETGQLLRLRAGGGELTAPALVLAGHAPRSISLALGYGRSGGERIAGGVGVDAYRLRDAGFSRDVEVVATDTHRALAITQRHDQQHDRALALHFDLADYRADPDRARAHDGPQPSWLPDSADGDGEQWAMSIDTSVCTGCSACVVACQAENNVPLVGREGVLEGREMHWLRIDRYIDGPAADPTVVHQPMLCQHCEKAPCEYVCPVNATVHSPDGLNEMVYNRCVGTRFCSNNCPYKVRRFNFLLYQDWETPQFKLQRNPDVSVRSRGVMEKCTYCVQRINRVRIAAERDGRRVEDGAIQTACQQACPSQAIHFGDLNDPASKVAATKRDPRNYVLLGELGTRPRTSYLAVVQNPNPELAG